MITYRKVDCPHCGNEISVNSGKKTTKCRWCKRCVGINFKGTKAEVYATEFPTTDTGEQNFANWKGRDIHG